MQEGKLTASEELGDLFKGASDWDTAQAIYQASGASGKVVEALAAKGDFDQLVRAAIAHVPVLCCSDRQKSRWSYVFAPSRNTRSCDAVLLQPDYLTHSWFLLSARTFDSLFLRYCLVRPAPGCRHSTHAPAAPRPITSSCCSVS